MDERPENQQVANLQHEPENECRKKNTTHSEFVCFPFLNFSVSVSFSVFCFFFIVCSFALLERREKRSRD